jgi:hypothetical protein
MRGILIWVVAVLAGGWAGRALADGPPQRWAMPPPARTVVVTRTMVIPAGTEVDFEYTRLVPARSLGDGSQREAQRPVMILMKGASVRRLIIGRPGADGIHCRGKNTLRDVWFEDVGEDAVTVEGADVRWIGGGARRAEDKIVQMNHAGPFRGENLFFQDFTTGVRGNGNDAFKRTPFRVLLRQVGARRGVCLVRFSNPAARAELRGLYLREVGRVGRADGGSRIVWRE